MNDKSLSDSKTMNFSYLKKKKNGTETWLQNIYIKKIINFFNPTTLKI